MSTGRIVSTTEARNAALQMKQIVNGGVADEINRLIVQGNLLADPMNFDGPTAAQYRMVWQEAQSAMRKMLMDLSRLQTSVETVNLDIARAGGA